MVTGSTSISSSRSRVPSSRHSNGAHAGSRTSIGSNGSSSSANQSYVNAKSSHTAATSSDGARTIHRKGSVPFQSITNREGSSSQDDTFRSSSSGMSSSMKQRKQSDGAGDTPYERAPGPRLSQDAGRSNSHRIPSALRRLPPAGSRVASRSVVPSGAHSSSLNAGDHSAASSSGQHPPSSSARAGVSALARANGRRSLGASMNAAGAGGAAQHERDGREITKLTVDSTSFEEWMKMATDNKINATNTWNFALIDYFHDMSLLRSDNGDGSINFQKASCTLDGCVKVWTSRVDSVVVETGKLLSGLQDDSKEANSKNGRSRNDDEDGDGADMDDDADGRGPRRKKNRAKEPTLVKSFNQLTVKKLDLEFTVDPLFKKTSADFDEGGAGGLLMNHLGVDSKARVVFDASDVPGQDDADEEDRDTSVAPPIDEEDMEVLEDEDDEIDSAEKARRGATADDSQDLVDLSKLRAKLFGQHDVGNSEDALGELLNGMTVCPTFAVFKFAPNDNTLFSELTANDGPDAFGTHQSSAMPDWDMGMNDLPEFDEEGEGMFDDGNLDDAFGGLALPSGPSGAYFGAEGDAFGLAEGGMDEGMDGGMGANDYGEPGEGPSAASRAPIDFTTSLQGLLDGSGGQAFQGDDFFGYFDQRMNKNWAGPEHWKMRNMTTVNGQPTSARAPGEKGPAARKQKEPFVIDFTSAEGAVTSKELFEKPASQASTLLPNSKEPDNLYLLPEDRHFSSRQLLRLFIKPRAILNPRRTGQVLEMQGAPRSDADADFWVQAAVQRSASGTYQGEEGLALGFDAGEDGGMAAFDTQFFHEDDGGFDDAMDEVVGNAMALEPEDEELTTQALKRIRPEFVNYAKKAKQVDIRKLKENIWRELAIAVDDDDDEQEGEESGDTSDEHTTPKAGSEQDAMALDVDQSRPRKSSSKRDPTDPRAFESVLTGLRKLYSKDRMDEISTSFCFICLLHLANEEGLRIRTAPDGIGGLGMLAGRAIVEDDEEEDEENDNVQRRSSSRDVFSSRTNVQDSDDGDRGRVGYLEQLSIAKDPNAGRSA